MFGVAAMVMAGTPHSVMAAARIAPVVRPTVPEVPDESTNYQVNASHDGHVEGGTEAPPLTTLWTKDFAGPPSLSYPLLTGGRVYVVTQEGSSAELHAFDAATGADAWGPVDIGFTGIGLAAGDGQVFTLSYDGLLSAFDQADGHSTWIARLPGQFSFTSAPTYHDGAVYATGAGSGGTLYAVDSASGNMRWSVPVQNGDQSSPAVTDTGVYTSFACELTTDSSPVDGHPIWTKYNGCEGGGGRTPVLGAGSLWVRDSAGMSPAEYDPDTGALEGTFASGPPPAFDGTTRFVLDDGTLKAADSSTNSQLWSAAGDGGLVTAPFVDNGFVYEGSSTGALFVYDEHTGQQVFTTNAGAPFLPSDEGYGVLQGIAAGNGRVAVSASNRLVVYGSGNLGDRYTPLDAPFTRARLSAAAEPGWPVRQPLGPRSESRRGGRRGRWRAGRRRRRDRERHGHRHHVTVLPHDLAVRHDPAAGVEPQLDGGPDHRERGRRHGRRRRQDQHLQRRRQRRRHPRRGRLLRAHCDRCLPERRAVRVVDSRPPPNRVGAFGSPWVAGQSRDVAVAGVDGVPSDADAVIVNATVTDTTSPSYLTISPSGTSRPLASSLNWRAGQTIANEVVAKVGANGKVSIFNAVGSADVILDVVGYFHAGAGAFFHPIAPERFQDSRTPPESEGAPTRPRGDHG